MAHVAVVGAGPAGLVTSLLLARRGYSVSLVEKDADEAPADPDQCFAAWSRRGVAQARQPHILLGASSAVLRAEAPDVLEALVAGGANLLTNAMERVPSGHTEAPYFVCTRRLPFEATLRRHTLMESGIRLMAGVEAVGLVAEPGPDAPVVRGLTLADGSALAADLTVDASGRFSGAPQWLARLGVEPPAETFQDCGFCYITRWYRLKPGESFPAVRLPATVFAAFANFMAFPGDGDVFGLTMTLSMRDPLRAAVMSPATFDAIMAAMPATAQWLERAEAISAPQVLGRIENRSRSLVRDGGPVVAGLALVGDSAIHTNPTVGRGVSMAYLQAQRLAAAADDADLSSVTFALAQETWRTRTLATWFDNQAAADARRLAAIDAALAGDAPLEPVGEAARFAAALPLVAAGNPEVAEAFTAMMHMMITPEALAADAAVRSAVTNHLRSGGGLMPMTGLSRAAFEALARAD